MGSTELRRRRSTPVSASRQADQPGQPHGAAGFPAPASQIDAAEHDLAIAARQAAHLLDHLRRRERCGCGRGRTE